MKWKVVNAISRDVERQHLNKILAEIEEALSNIKAESVSQEEVRTIVVRESSGGGGGGSSPSTPTKYTITLKGDVTGTASGTGTITIDAKVDPSILGIGEAPIDSNAYWRIGGTWQAVPFPVVEFRFLEDFGYTKWTEDGWVSVTDEQLGVDAHTIVLKASGTIHGRRAVAVEDGEIYHPDLSEPSDAVKIVGISIESGEDEDDVRVQTGGLMRNPTWSWVAGPVYSDDEGVLTQTAPSTGWIVCVGRAIDETTIDVNVLLSLLRS